MTHNTQPSRPTRRQILTRIGLAGGSALMYQAMAGLGHAAASDFRGAPMLQGSKKGTKVVVLGAGLAGMLSAYELTKAGYTVEVLEFQDRIGGRNMTLRGGDTVRELGGATQKVGFAPGNYINPGPWRIPYHHQAVLHYCRELGVQLEPYIELNHNSWLHCSQVFGGKPVRYREFAADFTGFTSELLCRAVDQHKLDDALTEDERHQLRTAMVQWGALEPDMAYRKGTASSIRRGYAKPEGGGLTGEPVPSDPFALKDLLGSGLWNYVAFHEHLDLQTTMFQPVGGMDMIGKGFARKLPGMITLNCEVSAIHQDDHGVTVTCTDRQTKATRQVQADYCVCTVPLSVLSQMDVQASAAMKSAILAVPYHSSIKLGLEFKRRFWEEDEQIYGGISFTDQPISQISYPSQGCFSLGPAVLLGGYMFDNHAYDFAGMTPQERIEQGLAQGSVIHKQYRKEFLNGVGFAWSRMPWILGCYALWTEQSRKAHYKNLCAVDNRLVLAGEHASYINGWQEGAILSALDAITRLHKRAIGAA